MQKTIGMTPERALLVAQEFLKMADEAQASKTSPSIEDASHWTFSEGVVFAKKWLDDGTSAQTVAERMRLHPAFIKIVADARALPNREDQQYPEKVHEWALEILSQAFRDGVLRMTVSSEVVRFRGF